MRKRCSQRAAPCATLLLPDLYRDGVSAKNITHAGSLSPPHCTFSTRHPGGKNSTAFPIGSVTPPWLVASLADANVLVDIHGVVRWASCIALDTTLHHPGLPLHPNRSCRSTKFSRNPRIRVMIFVITPASRHSGIFCHSVSAFTDLPP